ncbi:hypothetical protein DEF23_02155 [Marinitenerispora sediminis]|uniref:Uncharacterized protein n=2 Tax=Marinitenerispora sediminis TaxID=1931232 RepID=A0A368TC21_9ACTN|nr:hypothetical protein DEF28_00340 [Marinitenerispora sediminis]RCV61446.1 hypothetical protein DEF23_02155 [Marinitenerispora sediminis]RCV62526.1 hypothetical protein DEF24_00690 [Marinitenerispora sediminis]
MRLVFTNADQDTFDEYRSLFITRTLAHCRAQGTTVPRAALEILLDFKYGEPDEGGDGLLARWNEDDVAALLLGWLPEEAVQTPPPLRDLRAALDAWYGFLQANGWLDPRSDGRDALLATMDELADAYRQAVDNPEQHRIAKYLQRALLDSDVDVDDPEQLADFEAGIDAGDLPVDEETLAGIAEGSIEAPKAPVDGIGRVGYVWRAPRLLEGDELAAAMEAAPTLARLRRESPDELSKDSEEAWLQAYDAVGPAIAEGLGLDAGSFEDAFGLDPEEFVVAAVTVLFTERPPLPAPVVLELVAEAAGALDDDEPLTDDLTDRFGPLVDTVIAELEKLGVLERDAACEEAEDAGEPVLRLTPLGEWIGYEELSADDYVIRTFEELMAENAEVLVERAASGQPSADVDLDDWIESRDTATAVRELVEVARRTDDCGHRFVVACATREHAAAARPVYESLREDPAFGPQARTWLFDAGFLKEDDLQPDDRTWVTLDTEAALARLGLMDDEQLMASPWLGADPQLFEIVMQVEHPESAFLLGYVGEHHPDPKVRKEARTTLYRLRSRGTNAKG